MINQEKYNKLNRKDNKTQTEMNMNDI